jgi:FdhD protein
LVALAEDVDRHNAVNKVIGLTALKGLDFGECFLALSGRISGDVSFKAANVGLPIIASIAVALSSGIDMAEKAKITLASLTRGKRIKIYTFPERITF